MLLKGFASIILFPQKKLFAEKVENVQFTCADDIRPRFAFGSSSIPLYIEEAGDVVGINDIPEPMPKLRAIKSNNFH